MNAQTRNRAAGPTADAGSDQARETGKYSGADEKATHAPPPPWFRLFATDFQSATSGMKAAEKGIYITLLIAMHEFCGPVEEDTRRLARRSGTTASAFETALRELIRAGLVERTDAGLWAPAAQRETENRALKSKSAKENASKRWEKEQQNQRSENAKAYKSQSQSQRPESEREVPIELHAADTSQTSGRRPSSTVVETLQSAPERAPRVSFRAGAWYENSQGRTYLVLAVDDDARTFTVRFADSEQPITLPAPPGAVLLQDRSARSSEDTADDIPF